MNIKNIIILVIAIVLFSQCEKMDPEESYSNEVIALDNAQAALYFHTVFREAENAWAFIDSKHYVSGEYDDPKMNPATPTISKVLVYDEDKKSVTIRYNAWVSDNLLLIGNIKVEFNKDSYCRDAQKATIYLTDFSINWQNVTGRSQIIYAKVNGNDHYSYILYDPSSIHKEGDNKPELISGGISNGQYERIKGKTTLLQDDDEWAYSGTMKGRLREDPKLSFTNKVLAPYTENGETKDERVFYAMGCKTAKHGISQITISGRPDIKYRYACSEIEFVSTTNVH